MIKLHPRHDARLAIFLVVVAANVGIAARLFILGLVGQFLFILTRILILVLPLIWFFWIDQDKLVASPPSKRQSVIGVTLGLLMFAVIFSTYWFIGRQWINPIDVQSKATQIGITSFYIYSAGALYFTFINSLIEEYVWRWFLCRKCEILFSQAGALYFSALCFTLHHIIALTAYTGNWFIVVAGSLGVFIAGMIWSWCYLTYRSLWACYISHVLADSAIAIIGWHLLFTSTR